jgi:hypothetical protein
MNSSNSPYFRSDRKAAKRAGPCWVATASIVRTDTDELVEIVRAKGARAEEADQRLTAALTTTFATLQRPEDWGKDATVPHLLQRYLRMRDEAYGRFLLAETAAGAEASSLKREAEVFERGQIKAISEQVAALNERQRLELAGLTNEQRTRLSDARTLDVLTAKKRLSELIPNPSSAVQTAYRDLAQAVNQ